MYNRQQQQHPLKQQVVVRKIRDAIERGLSSLPIPSKYNPEGARVGLANVGIGVENWAVAVGILVTNCVTSVGALVVNSARLVGT